MYKSLEQPSTLKLEITGTYPLKVTNTLWVLQSVWYMPQGLIIGIVMCYDTVTCSVKSYIGNGFGNNEAHDAHYIAMHGQPFYDRVFNDYRNIDRLIAMIPHEKEAIE